MDIVGKLCILTDRTRSEIQTSVNVLGYFNSTLQHVKTVLRYYLKDTAESSLMLGGNEVTSSVPADSAKECQGR